MKKFVQFVREGNLTPVWLLDQITMTRKSMMPPVWFWLTLIAALVGLPLAQ